MLTVVGFLLLAGFVKPAPAWLPPAGLGHYYAKHRFGFELEGISKLAR